MFFIHGVLRSKCLQTLHSSHPNVTVIQLGAFSSMYWSNINKELMNTVNLVSLTNVYPTHTVTTHRDPGQLVEWNPGAYP